MTLRRHARRRLRAGAGLAAAAVALGACGATDDGSAANGCDGVRDAVAAADGALAAQEAGGALPDAELAVLGEDRCLAFSELVGTPMVINFWATWCTFCVDEMPGFQAASEALAGQVTFVGIDREDAPARAEALVRETGVDYLLLEDPTPDTFRALQGRGMPTTVLVDAAGTVRYRHAGPLSAETLLDLVEQHLGVSA